MAQQVPAAFDRQNRIIQDRIIRRREVEARVGLRRSTIYARIAAGTFPKPVSLGARAVGWVEAEISEWIEARISAGRAAA